MFGVFFFVSLFVQQILGYSPTQAGAAFLPWTLLIVVLAPQSGRISDRVGARWLVTSGMIVLAGSLFLFSRMGAGSDFWTLLPAMILGGIGMGVMMAPVTATAMGSVPRDKAGVGSAVLNSMRQVGGSIVAAAVTGNPAVSRQSQFLTGFHHALEVATVIALFGAVIAALTLRKVPHPEPVPGQAQAPAPPVMVEA
jgi:predicted MFS family arabinose efflux permease